MLPFCIQSQNIQIQINKINTDHIEGVTTKYGKQNVKLKEKKRKLIIKIQLLKNKVPLKIFNLKLIRKLHKNYKRYRTIRIQNLKVTKKEITKVQQSIQRYILLFAEVGLT